MPDRSACSPLLLLLPALVGFTPKVYATPQKSDPAPVTAPGETTTASAEAVPTPQHDDASRIQSTRRAEVNAGYGMVVSEIETQQHEREFASRAASQRGAAMGFAEAGRCGLRYSGHFSSVQYSDYFTPEGRLQLHIHYIAPELVMRQQVWQAVEACTRPSVSVMPPMGVARNFPKASTVLACISISGPNTGLEPPRTGVIGVNGYRINLPEPGGSTHHGCKRHGGITPFSVPPTASGILF